MAPTSHTYLDYYQGPAEKEPLAIGGYLPLRKVYEYEPVPKAIVPQKTKHVLGVQGQLWGEYISTPQHLEYMATPVRLRWPRSDGHKRGRKDYENFLTRLHHHIERLRVIGICYRPPEAGK